MIVILKDYNIDNKPFKSRHPNCKLVGWDVLMIEDKINHPNRGAHLEGYMLESRYHENQTFIKTMPPLQEHPTHA